MSDEEDQESLSSPRKITFDKVEVRNYSRDIGDNPSVSIGVPVTLDWGYDQEESIRLTEYEKHRTPLRRTQKQFAYTGIIMKQKIVDLW